ncbi:MAG TPA: MATE family efflux transporter, partial [Methylomirabilota bacterium]|nr:MATE family efflux transporter [Methylomirabilota bacterium]
MTGQTTTITTGRSAAALPGPLHETATLLRAAAPFAAVGLLNMAVSITDSVMIGALGPAALATGALVSDARAIVFYFVGGGFIALAPLIAAASAEGDATQLRRLFGAGLRLAIVLAAVSFPIVMSLGWTLPAMGIALPDRNAAVAFAISLAFACTAMVFAQFARSVLAPLGRGRTVVIAMAAAVPINALANTVLMFGPEGMPRLGIAGAGYGAALAYAIVAVWLMAVSHGVADVSPLRALSTRSQAFRPLAAATLMTGFGLLCETGLYLAATLAVGRFAPAATPEHVVAFRILGLCYCVLVGVGQATSIAAARSGAAFTTVVTAFGATLAAGLACSAATHVAVMRLVPAGFADDPAATAALALHVAVAVLALAFAVVGLSGLRGRGAVRASAVIAVAGYWGVGVLALAIVAATGDLGLLGIWKALIAGTLATALAAWV